jgi:hypothetical protein
MTTANTKAGTSIITRNTRMMTTTDDCRSGTGVEHCRI